MSLAEYDLARDLWLTRGQPREALAHVLKAVELDEENSDAAHLAALIYLDFCRRGTDAEDCRLEQAEKQARHALAVKADFREARNTLGVILIHQKRYAEAVRELTPLTTDILYRTPENAWGNIGWAYLEQGALPDARQALLRSVAAQPDFCVGYYRLGLTEERSRRAKEAIEAYTQALNAADGRCTGLQEAYAGRARVLSKLNRVDEAQRDLATCVRLDRHTEAGRECLSLQSHGPPAVTPQSATPPTTLPQHAIPQSAATEKSPAPATAIPENAATTTASP
ncbi:MAG TPA: tetratricopeptide repeat protein [Polyangiaceae bacterium]|nr:tetratricopeptide repeat protein [Polyangiaceae bacterium]